MNILEVTIFKTDVLQKNQVLKVLWIRSCLWVVMIDRTTDPPHKHIPDIRRSYVLCLQEGFYSAGHPHYLHVCVKSELWMLNAVGGTVVLDERGISLIVRNKAAAFKTWELNKQSTVFIKTLNPAEITCIKKHLNKGSPEVSARSPAGILNQQRVSVCSWFNITVQQHPLRLTDGCFPADS